MEKIKNILSRNKIDTKETIFNKEFKLIESKLLTGSRQPLKPNKILIGGTIDLFNSDFYLNNIFIKKESIRLSFQERKKPNMLDFLFNGFFIDTEDSNSFYLKNEFLEEFTFSNEIKFENNDFQIIFKNLEENYSFKIEHNFPGCFKITFINLENIEFECNIKNKDLL